MKTFAEAFGGAVSRKGQLGKARKEEVASEEGLDKKLLHTDEENKTDSDMAWMLVGAYPEGTV